MRGLSKLKEPKPCKWEGKLVPLQRTIREYVSADRACSGVTGALDRLSRLEEPPVCKWTERDSVALMRSIREYGSATRTVAECANGLKAAYGSFGDSITIAEQKYDRPPPAMRKFDGMKEVE